MANATAGSFPPSVPELSRQAAIIGVGETDYGHDYQAQRARTPGYIAPTVEELSIRAFERALADSGLRREAIDGLTVSYTFGGPAPAEMADRLRVKPRYCATNGNIMAGPLPIVCAAIASGKAETVAMIFSIASRSIGRQFGGSTDAAGAGVPSSYYYFHPWGWSSQAAHWALVFSHYQATYGVREEDLGHVAVQVRTNALADPNALMRVPLDLDQYMASRYIVRPLHLHDICLVNDGAVCLIVTRADKARDAPHTPVLVAGWAAARATANKLDNLVRARLRPQMQQAGHDALAMAGLAIDEVQHFEGYDASTIHLISQVEGYGFTGPGTGLDFCKAGEMGVGGSLPVNTAGGNLSGSYMQGWSQVVEVVRQLRHEAEGRQIKDVQVSMSSLVQTDQAHPILFVRGG